MRIKNKFPRIFVLSFIFIILFNIIQAQAKTYHLFKLDLTYLDGNIKLKSINVEPFSEAYKTTFGLYQAEILDFEGNLLNLTFFDIPLEIYFDIFDEESGEISGGGVRILNQTEITLLLPYYENAKEINIYDQDFNKKLIIDVTDFSKVNKIEKDQGIEKPKEIQSKKLPNGKKGITSYLLYSILALVIILIIIFLIRGLRKQNYE